MEPTKTDTYPKTLTCPECEIKFTLEKRRRGKPQRFCSKKCRESFHAKAFARLIEAGKSAMLAKSA